jgi:hypothetical protein
MPSTNHQEPSMSADRHRGIRREKQKRAKDAKRQQRQQSTPAPAPMTGAAADKPAA